MLNPNTGPNVPEFLQKERAAARAERLADSGVAGMQCDAAREKTWEERLLEEKVELLRHELMNMTHMAEEAHRLAHEVLQIAREHKHLDGEIVMPINHRDHPAMTGGQLRRRNPLL